MALWAARSLLSLLSLLVDPAASGSFMASDVWERERWRLEYLAGSTGRMS
jgi:hypothetical protein